MHGQGFSVILSFEKLVEAVGLLRHFFLIRPPYSFRQNGKFHWNQVGNLLRWTGAKNFARLASIMQPMEVLKWGPALTKSEFWSNRAFERLNIKHFCHAAHFSMGAARSKTYQIVQRGMIRRKEAKRQTNSAEKKPKDRLTPCCNIPYGGI